MKKLMTLTAAAALLSGLSAVAQETAEADATAAPLTIEELNRLQLERLSGFQAPSADTVMISSTGNASADMDETQEAVSMASDDTSIRTESTTSYQTVATSGDLSETRLSSDGKWRRQADGTWVPVDGVVESTVMIASDTSMETVEAQGDAESEFEITSETESVSDMVETEASALESDMIEATDTEIEAAVEAEMDETVSEIDADMTELESDLAETDVDMASDAEEMMEKEVKTEAEIAEEIESDPANMTDKALDAAEDMATEKADEILDDAAGAAEDKVMETVE